MITIDSKRTQARATGNARRQRFVRAARAGVISALLGCAALQLGLNLALEPLFPQFRDPFYYHKSRRLLARVHKEQPLTVVMLGSSRTAYGLCGQRIEGQLGERLGQPVVVYNSGLFGSGPIAELLYLKRMVQEGLRPDLLLIEVLPTCLAETERGPAEANWLDPCRLNRQELLFLEKYGIATREMVHDRVQDEAIPWYYHRFAILSCWAPGWLPLIKRMDFSAGADASGFAPCREPNTREERQRCLEKMRVQFGGSFINFHFSAAACQALDDALTMCRQRDIPAALVLMPEGKEFLKLYDGTTRSAIDGYLQAVSQTHGVPLLDARTWVEDGDFCDGHHLLPRGARVFTERLGREALPALLAERRLTAHEATAGSKHALVGDIK
jgi:hypothetical protein